MKNRRAIRREKTNINASPLIKKLLIYITSSIVLVSLVIFAFSFWAISKLDRTVISYALESGDAAIVMIDPNNKVSTTFLVPKDTYVSASHGRGNWRVRSLWKLGMDEKIGGSFFANSLIRSLRLPIDSWSSEEGTKLLTGNFIERLTSIFGNYKTNIPLVKRYQLFLFSLSTPTKWYDYDLAKGSYLVSETLPDGDKGFIVRDKVPEKIASIFADPYIASKHINISLKTSDSGSINSTVGTLLEVMGGKIVSTSNETINYSKCLVEGFDKVVLQKISKILNCMIKATDGNPQSIVVTLPSNFMSSF